MPSYYYYYYNISPIHIWAPCIYMHALILLLLCVCACVCMPSYNYYYNISPIHMSGRLSTDSRVESTSRSPACGCHARQARV